MNLLTKGKIDPADVGKYKAHYTDVWAPAHEKFRKAQQYYTRQYQIWPDTKTGKKDERSDYYPSDATSVVDHAVDQNFSYNPKVHCFQVGVGEVHEKRTSLKEKFLTAVLNDSSLWEAGLTGRMLIKYLLLYGYVVGELTITLEGMLEEPERQEGESDALFEARK